MNRRRLIATFAVLTTTLAGAVAYPSPRSPELAVGQEWTLLGWPEPSARLIIGRFDTQPGGRIAVGAGLVGLIYDGGPAEWDFVPFEKVALERSLGRLVRTRASPPPSFEDGYRAWKASGQGVFPIGAAALTAMWEQAPARRAPERCSRGPLDCP